MTTQIKLQNALREYLEHCFPQQKHTRILNLTRISDGWETDVYSFSIQYQRNGKPCKENLILRLYPGDGASGKAAKEFHAMAKLHQIGYPVPKVHHLETDRPILGKPFVIMDEINGQALGKILEASTQARREGLYLLFVKLFVNLHNQDTSPFLTDHKIIPDSTGYDISNPYSYLDRLLAGYRHTLATLETDEPAFELFSEILNWLAERKQTVPCRRLSPVHLDYHPYNILVDSAGQPFVIDWTNFDITDYRLDLAWTLMLATTYGRPEMRDSVLRTYKDTADSKIENIEYFEAIAATRRLGSIYLSLKKGAEKLGMRPETTEALKRQTEHIQAVCRVLSARTGIPLRRLDGLLKP